MPVRYGWLAIFWRLLAMEWDLGTVTARHGPTSNLRELEVERPSTIINTIANHWIPAIAFYQKAENVFLWSCRYFQSLHPSALQANLVPSLNLTKTDLASASPVLLTPQKSSLPSGYMVRQQPLHRYF